MEKSDERRLVLHIIYDLSVAGAQTVVMNYLRQMENDEDFKIGVIVRDGYNGSPYEKEVKEKGYLVEFCEFKPFTGSKLFRPIINWIRCTRLIHYYILKYKPDIVHTHLANIIPFASFATIGTGVNVKIHTLHSDPYAVEKRFALWTFFAIHFLGFYPVCVTKEQAEKAKKRYRLNKYSVIRNGINVNRYQIPETKESIRKELGIGEKQYVIGFVGTLCPIKNLQFLIRLFSEYHEKDANSLLLLVGAGEDRKILEDYCRELGVIDNVVFTGQRNDVERMLKAMDLFMLVSKYESSSIVTVEAQAAGVRCIVSEAVPRSVLFSDKIIQLSLNDTDEKWLEAMRPHLSSCRKDNGIVKFSLKHSIEQTKRLYNCLLEGKKPK